MIWSVNVCVVSWAVVMQKTSTYRLFFFTSWAFTGASWSSWTAEAIKKPLSGRWVAILLIFNPTSSLAPLSIWVDVRNAQSLTLYAPFSSDYRRLPSDLQVFAGICKSSLFSKKTSRWFRFCKMWCCFCFFPPFIHLASTLKWHKVYFYTLLT